MQKTHRSVSTCLIRTGSYKFGSRGKRFQNKALKYNQGKVKKKSAADYIPKITDGFLPHSEKHHINNVRELAYKNIKLGD